MKRKSVGSGSGMRRSEVYPALLRLRAALRRQTPADRMLLAWVERVLRSLDTSAP